MASLDETPKVQDSVASEEIKTEDSTSAPDPKEVSL